MRRVLKRLQVPLPHEAAFNTSDNLKGSLRFEVLDNPVSYRDKKFFGTHQLGGWSDYRNQDSMTRWIIEKSQALTDVGLLRI